MGIDSWPKPSRERPEADSIKERRLAEEEKDRLRREKELREEKEKPDPNLNPEFEKKITP